MSPEQLQAIRDRASPTGEPMARWNVMQAMEDRVALLRLVDELQAAQALPRTSRPPVVTGTDDTADLPSTGVPHVVRVLRDPEVGRFRDVWSHWRPGLGWRTDARNARLTWSTLDQAEVALESWLAQAPLCEVAP